MLSYDEMKHLGENLTKLPVYDGRQAGNVVSLKEVVALLNLYSKEGYFKVSNVENGWFSSESLKITLEPKR